MPPQRGPRLAAVWPNRTERLWSVTVGWLVNGPAAGGWIGTGLAGLLAAANHLPDLFLLIAR